MLLADDNTTELTDDSIIALVTGQEFDQDAYMAQLKEESPSATSN